MIVNWTSSIAARSPSIMPAKIASSPRLVQQPVGAPASSRRGMVTQYAKRAPTFRSAPASGLTGSAVVRVQRHSELVDELRRLLARHPGLRPEGAVAISLRNVLRLQPLDVTAEQVAGGDVGERRRRGAGEIGDAAARNACGD